ncbi:hypothetical protein ABGB12_32215 [Actinocorallia sp. B10E7]|uniref:hypothetical protein n=1 Tax=Actinocorallia sp. B10E7 TaxID=3153558 RepID=UPI00325ED3C8
MTTQNIMPIVVAAVAVLLVTALWLRALTTLRRLRRRVRELEWQQQQLPRQTWTAGPTDGEWQRIQGELRQARDETRLLRETLQHAEAERQQLLGELQQARAEAQMLQRTLQHAEAERQQLQNELVRTHLRESEPPLPPDALERLGDPQALPDAPDTLPDSVVDGARFGSLTVRAGAVRGELGRNNGFVRKQTVGMSVLTKTNPPTLVTCVAAGLAGRATSGQLGAVQACRSLPDKLADRAAALDLAWRNAAAGAPSAELAELLAGAVTSLNGPLNQVAKERSLRPSHIATEVSFLLTRLGDAGRRRHLVAGVGAGALVRITPDGRWTTEFRAGDGERPTLLPESSGPPAYAFVESEPGDVLLLCSGTAAEFLERDTTRSALTEHWSKGAPSLAHFLWQLGLRDQLERMDRAIVGLWEHP